MMNGLGRIAAGLATMAIATACGAAQNDAPVGEPIGPGGEPSISVDRAAAGADASVEVTASGFPAQSEVVIGFGPPQSEFEEVTRTTTDEAGALTVSVRIPEWAEEGREYVWVVDEPVREGRRAVSSPFRVAPGNANDGERITIEGRVTEEGVECPAIRTADDRLYTLAGSSAELQPGQRVRVTGEPVEISFCQQGTTLGNVEVERIPG